MSQPKKASKRLEELRNRHPMLASIFTAIPLNRRALDAEQAEIDDAEHEAEINAHVARLEKAEAVHTIELESLRASGQSVRADIYAQAHAIELRDEAEYLADLDDDGPEAA